ncbi:PIF-2 [Macrobrachium rosenbergii nudivirus]|nr:PIF-2 [Macrobrachium rosenbergii nudivirus]
MELKKHTIGKYYFLVLSIIIIVVLVSYFAILKINPEVYEKYLTKLRVDVVNDKIMNLKNANTIANLPNIILKTDNEQIDALVDCKNKLKYLGPIDENKMDNYLNLCKNKCGGAGNLQVVENDNDFVYDNKFVKKGVYCTVDPVNCNHNTGYVVATVNSVTCRTKYPNMFGGETATAITACNNEKYPSTGSILWDYANNEAVDPLTVNMTHEDELLPDGSFRFACKFAESNNKNPYIKHPLNRFHPIIDKCNDSIYAADYSVHAVIDDKTWYCDCGDYNVTRVKNLDQNDPKSICTSCFREKVNNTYKVPYMCYNKDSLFHYTKKYQPCIEFKSGKNMCEKLDFETKFKIFGTPNSLLTFTKVSDIDLSIKYEIR